MRSELFFCPKEILMGLVKDWNAHLHVGWEEKEVPYGKRQYKTVKVSLQMSACRSTYAHL